MPDLFVSILVSRSSEALTLLGRNRFCLRRRVGSPNRLGCLQKRCLERCRYLDRLQLDRKHNHKDRIHISA